MIKLGLIRSLLTFSAGTVEPKDGIDTALDQLFGNFFLGSRLHQQESFLHFFVAINLLKLFLGFVPAETLFKEFSLSIVAGEINKDPPFGVFFLHLFIFGGQVSLLGFQSLHVLLFQVHARLEFFINFS